MAELPRKNQESGRNLSDLGREGLLLWGENVGNGGVFNHPDQKRQHGHLVKPHLGFHNG